LRAASARKLIIGRGGKRKPALETPAAERHKIENADLSLSPEEKAAKLSAHNLSEFQAACRIYLPKRTKEVEAGMILDRAAD
jgi:hypothetical protein